MSQPQNILGVTGEKGTTGVCPDNSGLLNLDYLDFYIWEKYLINIDLANCNRSSLSQGLLLHVLSLCGTTVRTIPRSWLGFISHWSSCCQIKSICGYFLNVSRWFWIICCFAKVPTLMLRKPTNLQTMSGYSHREINEQPLCLSSHSYSFIQSWRNESSHFTETAVKTSDPSGPPAHFDSGTSQHNKPTPYLFMSVDTVEPPTITWNMWLNLQVRVRSFSSSTPDPGCQEKQLPFSRNNSSAALLRDGVEGPGKVSAYCPPTDPGTYSCKSNKGVAHSLLRPASQISC